MIPGLSALLKQAARLARNNKEHRSPGALQADGVVIKDMHFSCQPLLSHKSRSGVPEEEQRERERKQKIRRKRKAAKKEQLTGMGHCRALESCANKNGS